MTLEENLSEILADFKADIVFYLGGIDPLETDRFGRLSLSPDGLRERDRHGYSVSFKAGNTPGFITFRWICTIGRRNGSSGTPLCLKKPFPDTKFMV